MPTPSYQITCTKNEKIADGIYEIFFTKPEGFTFKPGQFVLFDIPLVDDLNDIQTRAFSVASSPKEDQLIFAMKMKEGGRASRWIEELLKEGDEVRMQGPFGNFMLDTETEKDWLLICTSTGVAPFRSQLVSYLPEQTRRIDLIFGVRNEGDLFWQEWFENLAKAHENFFVHFALSQPTDDWKGHKGRVQTLAPLIGDDFTNKKVYVCGNPAMTGDLKKICLEDWGIEKQDFHMEGYI